MGNRSLTSSISSLQGQAKMVARGYWHHVSQMTARSHIPCVRRKAMSSESARRASFCCVGTHTLAGGRVCSVETWVRERLDGRARTHEGEQIRGSGAPLISQRIRNFCHFRSHVNFFGVNQRSQKAVQRCEPASRGSASLTAWPVPSALTGCWCACSHLSGQPQGTLRTLAGPPQTD